MKKSPETLISQPEARRLFGRVSDMTWWRWRQAGIAPEPIVINRRNYYRADELAKMQEEISGRAAA